MSEFRTRVATPTDQGRVVETLARAFADDPVWGRWAFAGMTNRVPSLLEFWVPFVDAAFAYDGIVMTDGGEAVSLWVPPDAQEFDEAGEAVLVATVRRVCGERADIVLGGIERFEAARPSARHWYLSLLATHPEHRGHGIGMALVSDQLARIDELHSASYLESTNPANIARYREVGFELTGSFTVPDGPTVDQMWRSAR